MKGLSLSRSAVLFTMTCAVTIPILGTACPGGGFPLPIPGPGPGPGPGPIVDIVTVELINNTAFPVDPNLFISGEFIAIDPPLAPGEIEALDIECFLGDILETDASLIISPFEEVASANVPFLEEGFEFLCGDVVTFIFQQDIAGVFFTEVEVNGFLVQ
jgi:hypothetical protein